MRAQHFSTPVTDGAGMFSDCIDGCRDSLLWCWLVSNWIHPLFFVNIPACVFTEWFITTAASESCTEQNIQALSGRQQGLWQGPCANSHHIFHGWDCVSCTPGFGQIKVFLHLRAFVSKRKQVLFAYFDPPRVTKSISSPRFVLFPRLLKYQLLWISLYLGKVLMQRLGRFQIWQLFLPTAARIIAGTSYFCIAQIVARGKYTSTCHFTYGV